MVVDRSGGKGWLYLVAVHDAHYYFASYKEADAFCRNERLHGNDARMYDIKELRKI